MTISAKTKKISRSQASTLHLAMDFAKKLRPGDVVGLVGPLGAGKTLFVKGLCEALGIDPAEVCSPTFTLIHHYQGSLPVYHFDVYRLENDREFEDLGYEEQFYGDGVSVVEWADKMKKFFPKGSYWVEFKMTGDQQRQIVFSRKARR